MAFLFVTLIACFFRFYQLADHPLGLFFDPAINGLDAIRFLQRGEPVIFFPTNGGREALLIYLLVPFIWLFGPTPFAFRLQLAIISLLNVVCLFAFLYHLRFTLYKASNSVIYHSQWAAWLATLAGLTLAVSPWHLAISRGDQRPLAVPLLAVLVFWFFLKGWNEGQKRWFIVSGLFLGLSFHTYAAARLLPLILLLAWLPELFLRPAPHAPHLRFFASRFLLLALPALLVAAPLGWYFVTHPAQFSARAASVMIWTYLDTPAAILAELGRNLLRVLGFFCCKGSPNAIFGLPYFPGLQFWLAPFLLLGLIYAFKNYRHLFFRLVALWWLIGIFPSLVAIEAPHPLRMIVALPATAILVALGLVWVWGFRLQASRFLVRAFPLLLILATVPGTFSAYFIQWPKLPLTQGIYDYGAVAIRNAVFAQAQPDRPIYLPLARFNQQPLLFYLSDRFRREAALTVPPADSALVIAPEKHEQDQVWVRLHRETATILPPLTGEGQRSIQTALAGNRAQIIRTPGGEAVASLAPLLVDPARWLQQPSQTLTVTFGPAQLVGAAYPQVLDPTSTTVPVTLYWQAHSPMRDDYEVILHLVDDARRVWGDGSARPNDWVYPTTFWRPGLETVAAQQTVKLSDALPPGRYWLAVALLNPATGQRFPITGGSEAPDTFFLGPLKVPLLPPAPLTEGEKSQATFDNVVQLLNYKIEPVQGPAGQPVQVDLFWLALKSPPRDYTVFVHLLDEQGRVVLGSDAQPVANRYPTSLWSSGERVLDTHTLTTPANLAPGVYRLAVGLYYQPTGERLPLRGADDMAYPDNQLILEPLVKVVEP